MIETTATVIMIVSERVGLRREEHALLLRNGYSVTEAQYGMDALHKLRDRLPNWWQQRLRFEDRRQGSNIHWGKDHDR